MTEDNRKKPARKSIKRILLQVTFGLGLTIAVIATSLSFGLLEAVITAIVIGEAGTAPSTSFRIFLVLVSLAILLLVLIALGQLVAHYTFRHRAALKVFIGVATWQLVWWLLFYSPHGFFWEPLNLDDSVSITWRTDVAALVLPALSISISFLAFRLATRPKQSH